MLRRSAQRPIGSWTRFDLSYRPLSKQCGAARRSSGRGWKIQSGHNQSPPNQREECRLFWTKFQISSPPDSMCCFTYCKRRFGQRCLYRDIHYAVHHSWWVASTRHSSTGGPTWFSLLFSRITKQPTVRLPNQRTLPPAVWSWSVGQQRSLGLWRSCRLEKLLLIARNGN